MTCKQGSAIKKLGQNRVTCNNTTASKTKKEKRKKNYLATKDEK
jgi:hypothetical protein